MNDAHEQRRGAMWKAWRRRQRHKANGLCLECTHKAVCGRQFCNRHLTKARVKAKHEYDWRVANGVCVSCGIPKEKTAKGTKCAACAGKAAAKERKRRIMGGTSTYLVSTLGQHNDALPPKGQQNRPDDLATEPLAGHRAADLPTIMAHKKKRPWTATASSYPASPRLPVSA
jgi:hypothetical protein